MRYSIIQKMTAKTFAAWMKRHNYNDTTAAEALGCFRHTVRRYREGVTTIPQYIALACQAISNGLGPMRDV